MLVANKLIHFFSTHLCTLEMLFVIQIEELPVCKPNTQGRFNRMWGPVLDILPLTSNELYLFLNPTVYGVLLIYFGYFLFS